MAINEIFKKSIQMGIIKLTLNKRGKYKINIFIDIKNTRKKLEEEIFSPYSFQYCCYCGLDEPRKN